MKHIKISKTFSRGFGIGPVFLVREEEVRLQQHLVSSPEEMEAEIRRFDAAVKKVSGELEILAADNPIFAGHMAMVNDFTLRNAVTDRISSNKLNVEKATDGAIRELKAVFELMDDAYMRERADDISDIGGRLLAALQERENSKFAALGTPSVVIAKDLLPSDTAMLDKNKVLGFITRDGGVTSHVSIMSKSLGIPALVGAETILEDVREGDTIAFDAASGDVYINPDEETLARLRAAKQRFEDEDRLLLEQATRPVVTEDGRALKVYANVGSLDDIEQGLPFAINGVGLFRSEFLFMGNDHFPTEEEQFEVYKKAIELLQNELIIRTLDIGGDKKLSYFSFQPEENPFLGWRAIRMTLDMPEIFKTQLRAILRASAFGPIKIMFPMIISISELERSKNLTRICMDELRAEGRAFNENIAMGIMVETPAVVMMAEDFARHCDFFSIGTNDLTQYMLAVDRGNKEIRDLYNSFHPAVLRAIAEVVRAANQAGIEVGMCGEFAGNAKATELLLGMGLDEFSMAAGDTPLIKEKLRGLHFGKAKDLCRRVLALESAAEIQEALEG